jgi:hypothetical protein
LFCTHRSTSHDWKGPGNSPSGYTLALPEWDGLRLKCSTGFRNGWIVEKRLADTPSEGAGGRDCKPGHPICGSSVPAAHVRRQPAASSLAAVAKRRPRSRGQDRRGFVTDDIRIAERPEDVAGRLTPSHWEGDLIKVWFADSYSSWQRGSNEIAERLNNRPRKVLDFETPNEVFARLVAEAKATAEGCCASGRHRPPAAAGSPAGSHDAEHAE